MALAQGKKSEYWNIEGQIVPIHEFPNRGEFYKNGSFQLPKYDKQLKKERNFRLCPKVIHFTNSFGYAGITAADIIEPGLSVNNVKFAWFSLIPEIQLPEGKLSPGVRSDASRYGKFKWSIDVEKLMEKFQNPKVKVLGTHVYQLEVMYALILCEADDGRFTYLPDCPDQNAENTTVAYTEGTFLWSPYTTLDEVSRPWDHLALGIADNVDISSIGEWEACEGLFPDCSTETITKADAETLIKLEGLRATFTRFPRHRKGFTVEGLSDAMNQFNLDALATTLKDLSKAFKLKLSS